MGKLKVILSILSKRKVYITPPCPCCGNLYTSRIVYSSVNLERTNYWIKDNAKRHGEKVFIIPEIRAVDSPNCYCDECNTTFHGYIREEYMTKQEREARLEEEYQPMGETRYFRKIKKEQKRKKREETFKKFFPFTQKSSLR